MSDAAYKVAVLWLLAGILVAVLDERELDALVAALPGFLAACAAVAAFGLVALAVWENWDADRDIDWLNPRNPRRRDERKRNR